MRWCTSKCLFCRQLAWRSAEWVAKASLWAFVHEWGGTGAQLTHLQPETKLPSAQQHQPALMGVAPPLHWVLQLALEVHCLDRTTGFVSQPQPRLWTQCAQSPSGLQECACTHSQPPGRPQQPSLQGLCRTISFIESIAMMAWACLSISCQCVELQAPACDHHKVAVSCSRPEEAYDGALALPGPLQCIAALCASHTIQHWLCWDVHSAVRTMDIYKSQQVPLCLLPRLSLKHMQRSNRSHAGARHTTQPSLPSRQHPK